VKFKLDENIGRRGLNMFEAAGLDVFTVHLQNLDGSPDSNIFAVCKSEERILVTLDLDFANPLIFDPRSSAGVAVIRLSRNPTPSELDASIEKLLSALSHRSIERSLWIVTPDRIRVWNPPVNGSSVELDTGEGPA
jgi:predicted nuclease of predicted toxin-antitoxin system